MTVADVRAPQPATALPTDGRGRHRAPSRAGRNLPVAVGVGLALGAAVVVPLFTVRWVFVAVVAVAVLVAVAEMTRSVAALPAHPPLVPLLTGGVLTVVLGWLLRGPEALAVGVLLTAVALVAWRLAGGPQGYVRDVTAGALIALYVPFLAGYAVLLAVPPDGARRVVTFMATVVCSDVGGYAAGVLFGRHPLAPTVSPKKSWEGFIGSAIACMIAGVAFLTLLYHGAGSVGEGVVFGLAMAVAATLGDLGESMLKRDLGVKDMGRLLPGHGGLMDRLDSVLVAAPVAYLLLTAFVPPR